MPLSFLVPAFLAGLAALGIPLLLHLTKRSSDRMVDFPSLMFVRRLPLQTEKRRRLRDVLLLAVRCAALALLVAAFARPFLDRPAPAAQSATGGREVVIALDRSLSMGHPGRWDRALAAAREEIDGLSGDDRATLLLFDDEAAATVRSTRDRPVLRAALAGARPGSGATRFLPALKLAESVLASSALPRRELVLISDFQRTGWEAEAGAESMHLPARTVVRPVSIADSAASNLVVTGVTTQRERLSGRERATLTARLVNRGERAFPGVPVALEVDGRVVERRTVPIGPNAAAAVAFGAITLADAGARVRVRMEGDGLDADNDFNLVLTPGEAIGVLVLQGAGSSRDASLYLARALGIGGEPGFDVEVRRAGALTDADLAGRSVVVLNDAPLPEGESGRRLRRFVEEGGGLIVAAGPTTARGGWGRDPDRLLAAFGGGGGEREDAGGAILASVDYGHPVFEAFSSPRSGDLTAARFYRYRALSPGADARVAARFGDGTAALAEARVGRGRVLAWASTLDQTWNDLALQPVFLPFVHRMVTHAAGYSPPGAWMSVGEVVAGDALGGAALTSARTPAGGQEELRPGTPLRLRERGFYSLRGGEGDARVERLLAVNTDPREADLTQVDPAEVAAAIAPARGAAASATMSAALAPLEQERSQRVWWYLLVLAAMALVADTVMGNRLSRAGR